MKGVFTMSQKHLSGRKSAKKKIYSWVMNCSAPVLTVILLAGSVCWASEAQYGRAVVFERDPEAEMVISSKGIANCAVEYTETSIPSAEEIPFENPVNSGAELVEACGIYIEDEFVGAVVDGENIQQELEVIIDGYLESDNVIEASYTIEPDLKQGIYRSETLVDESDMKDFLTGEKEVLTEYTAEKEDTPEKIAEDFGMSVDEVKELNPEIDKEIEDGSQVKIKEKVSVLPVKYVCEEKEEEVIELDTYSYNDSDELVSEGIRGRKMSTYQVTYIDGTEVSRKLTDSRTVEFPSEEDTNNMQEDLYSESVPDTAEIFSGEFIWPVSGGYISDTFGSDRNHKGLDIAADSGTSIFASDGGTVIDAGWNDGGYGNYVVIDHGNGYVTLYGHASEVYVSAGDVVSQGDEIAAVGSTGDSTGNHCHFEIRFEGDYLNPENFI